MSWKKPFPLMKNTINVEASSWILYWDFHYPHMGKANTLKVHFAMKSLTLKDSYPLWVWITIHKAGTNCFPTCEGQDGSFTLSQMINPHEKWTRNYINKCFLLIAQKDKVYLSVLLKCNLHRVAYSRSQKKRTFNSEFFVGGAKNSHGRLCILKF